VVRFANHTASIPYSGKLNAVGSTMYWVVQPQRSSTQNQVIWSSVGPNLIPQLSLQWLANGAGLGVSVTANGVFGNRVTESVNPSASAVVMVKVLSDQLVMAVNGVIKAIPLSGYQRGVGGETFLGSLLPGVQPLWGDILEVIGFEGDVPTADRVMIDTYLSGKWGIAVDSDGDTVPNLVEMTDGTDPSDPSSVKLGNQGLVAQYSFNGASGDESMRGNNALVVGARFTTDRFGHPNRALWLDGDDYVDTTVSFNMAPLSVSVWFRSFELGRVQGLVDSQNGSGGVGGNGILLGYLSPNNQLTVQYHDGAYQPGWTLADMKWHHAVAVYGSNSVGLYVDGALVGTNNVTWGTLDGTTLRLGGMAGRYWNGLIDDVKVYYRAISSMDVSVLYQDERLAKGDRDFDGVLDSQDAFPDDSTLVISRSAIAPTLNQLSITARTAFRAWYDASSANAMAMNTDSSVSGWIDWTGNQRHATQTTISQYPRWTSVAVDGKSGLVFDGSDWLDLDTSLLGNGAFTLVMVEAPSANQMTSMVSGIGGDGLTKWSVSYATANQVVWTGGSNPLVATSDLYRGSGYRIHTLMVVPGVGRLMYLNGILQSMDAVDPTLPTINWMRFGANGYKGQLAEVMLFSSRLSTQDRYLVDQHLIHKWQMMADTDMDGVPNGVELMDGTDPASDQSFKENNVGLMAYYPFTNSLNDESGNQQHGVTINAGFGSDRFGQIGRSILLDGSGSVMTPLESNWPQLSMVGWFRKSSNTGRRPIFDTDIPGRFGRSVMLGLSGGDNIVGMTYHDGEYASNYTVPDNDWHQVAVIYNGGRSQLLVDGVMIAEVNTTPGMVDGGRIRFGYQTMVLPYSGWVGELDDIRIYNRALTMPQVAQLLRQDRVNNDRDGDGVPDSNDTYPDDPTRVVNMSVVAPQLVGIPTKNWVLWLNPSLPNGVSVNGGVLKRWYDLTGNGHNAEPTYIAPAFTIGTGATFSGSTFDGLEIPYSSRLNSSPLTVIVVAKPAVISTSMQVLLSSETDSTGYALISNQGSWAWLGNTDTTKGIVGQWGAITRMPSVVRVVVSGSVLSMAQDAMMGVTLSIPVQVSNASNGFRLGGRALGSVMPGLFAGDIMEVMVFTEGLSSANWYQIDQYITTKWGVPVDSDMDRIPNSIDKDPKNPSIGVALPSGAIPDAILPSLKMWLVATANAIQTNTNARVTNWFDWSGNQIHVSVVGTPLLLLNGSSGINGLPSLGFTGSTLFKTADGSALDFGGRSPYTIMAIVRPQMTSGMLLAQHNAGVQGTLRMGYDNTKLATVRGNGATLNSKLITPLNQVNLVEVVYDGSIVTLYENAGAVASINSGLILADTQTPFTIGGQYVDGVPGLFSNVDIGEIMVFQTALSADDRATVERYLINKWALTFDTDGDGVPNQFDGYPNDDTRVVDIPNEISASGNLQLWLSGLADVNGDRVLDSGVSVAASDRTGVSKWFDWSGNRNHANQATSVLRPQLGSTGLVFDGVDDTMTLPVGVFNNQAFTLFIVERKVADVEGYVIGGMVTANRSLSIGYRDASGIVFDKGNGTSAQRLYHSSGDWAGSVVRVLEVTLSSSNGMILAINGTPYITGNTSIQAQLLANTGLSLGSAGSIYYKGTMMEVLGYKGELDSSYRLAIQQYLTQKWGVAFDLDGDKIPNSMDQAPTNNKSINYHLLVPGLASPLVSSEFQNNVRLWLMATSNLVYRTNGGLVTTWLDISGSSNHPTQWDNKRRPYFVDDATAGSWVQLNLEGSTFGLGEDEYDYLNFNGSFFVGKNYTVYVVEHRVTGQGTWFLDGIMFNNAVIRLGYNPSGALGMTHYSADGNVGASAEFGSEMLGLAVPRLHTALFSTQNGMAYYFNGVLSATNAYKTPMTKFVSAKIGSEGSAGYGISPYRGRIGEVLVFDTAISIDQRLIIDNYFGAKYGIEVDTDGDGYINQTDMFPTDNAKWTSDLDGDGVSDIQDAFPTDNTKVVNLAQLSPTLNQLSPSAQLSLKSWIESSSTNSFVMDSVGRVSRFFDLSGNRNHFSVLTPDLMPNVNRGGINNVRAAYFDGGAWVDLNTPFAGSNITILAVVNRVAIPGVGLSKITPIVVGQVTLANQYNHQYPITEDGGTNYIFSGRNSPIVRATQYPHPGNYVPYYVMMKYESTTNDMFMNGVWVSRGTWSGFDATGWRIGSDRAGSTVAWGSFIGYIGEVMFFHSALSEQDRYLVDEYISSKWKITVDSDGDGVSNQYDAFPTNNLRTVAPIADWEKLNLSVSPNLRLWTRTSTSNTEYILNSGKVTTWLDLSNLRNGFTISNTNNAPVLRIPSGNGLPMIGFDGLSQYLQTNLVTTRSHTTYMIIKTSVTGNGSLGNQAVSDTPILTGKVSGVANDSIPFSISGGVIRTYTGNPDATLSSGVMVNTNANRLVAVSREVNSGTRMIYVDGARVAMDTLGRAGVTLNASTQLTLGADLVNGRYWQGDVGEVMIFNTVIPTQDRYLLDQYFAKRWGVVVDTDGDGIANDVDLYPTSNINSATDLDGDGVPNIQDQFPLDPLRVVNASSYGGMATLMPNVQLWLVATSQAIASSSMGVVTWYDWSGLGRHATAINAPSLIGGMAGIQFNGTSQYVSLPYSVSLNQTPLTIIAVVEPIKIQNSGVLSTLGDGSGYSIGLQSSMVTLLRRGVAGVTISTPLVARASRKLLIVTELTSQNSVIRDGYGRPISLAMGGSDATQNAWLLGVQRLTGSSMGFYNGYVSEVMVLNRLLTESELSQLSLDMQARWGVGLDRDGDGWPDHIDSIPTDNQRLVPLNGIMPSYNLLSGAGKSSIRGWFGVSGNSVLRGNGDAIGAWANWANMTQSGWQSTVNAQPSVVGLGNTGQLGLGFDGQDWIPLDQGMVRNTPYTLMIIEHPQQGRTANYLLGSESGAGLTIGYHLETNQMVWSHGTNLDLTWANAAYSPDVPRIHTFQFDPAVGRFAYLNGALMASTNMRIAMTSLDGLQVGVASLNGITRFYNGVIAEIIGFNSVLSVYDRYMMDQYLATKYGVSMDTDGDGVPNNGDDYPMDSSMWGDIQAVAPPLNGVSGAAMQQLSLWLNTAYSPSVVVDAGGVIRIADLGTQKNHATQYTTGYRPRLVEDGGSKTYVYRPASPTFLTVPYANGLVSATQSVMMVVKWDGVKYAGGGSPGSQGVLWHRSTPQGEWVLGIDRTNAGEIGYRMGVPTDTGYQQLSVTKASSNTSILVGMIVTPQQLRLLIDGAVRDQIVNAGAMTASSGGTQLGRGTGFDSGWGGQIQEVMVFNTALSTPDRLVLDNYLGNKWNIPVDTDGDGDPNKTDPDAINPKVNTNDRDGDGVPNILDGFPEDPTKVVDFNAMTERASLTSGASLKGLSDETKRGLKGWYVATSSAMLVDGFGKVRSWFDWSGNQGHLIQSNSGLQPLFWGSAFGGRGAVQFDGLNDVLQWGGTPVVNQSFSVVVVEERLAAGTQYMIGGQAPLSTDLSGLVLGYQSETQAVGGLFGTGRYIEGGIGGLLVSPKTVHTLVFSKGVGSQYFLNASESPVGTTVFGDALTSYPNALVGGMSNGHYFNGNIVEIMVFSTTISTADRQIIESYMAAKWGIRFDSDGDGVPNDNDGYPYNINRVVDLPSAIESVSQNIHTWLSASGDHNGNAQIELGESGIYGILLTPTGNFDKWVDWSGKQQHVYPLRSSNLPQLTMAGINGLPSLQLSVSTSNVVGFISEPNGLYLASPITANQVTIWMVHRPSRLTTSTLFGSQSKKMALELNPKGQFDIYYNNQLVASSSMTIATGNASIITTEWALTGVSAYLNGVEMGKYGGTITADGVTLSIGLDPSQLGAYNGDIAEIVVVNSVLNPSLRQAVERYLGAKWGIAIDSDGDGVSDPYDAYPMDSSQVVAFPSALSTLKNDVSVWLSGSGDVTGNGGLTDSEDAQVSPVELDDRNRVMNWFDWSGNRRHMRQGIAINRPLPSVLNGLTSIGFDGQQQVLSMIGSGMAARPGTVLLVVQPRVSANMTVFSGISGLSIGFNVGATASDGAILQMGHQSESPIVSNRYLGNNTPMIVAGTIGDGGELTLRINGSVEGSTTLTQPIPLEPWVMGKDAANDTRYFAGSIGEVIAFNRVLTDAEMAMVNRYLSTKWKLLNDADGDGIFDLLDDYPDDPLRVVSMNRVSATLNQVIGISHLQLWLMADRGVNLQDNKVVAWLDWSGKQNHLYQNQGNLLPILFENGLNGRSVVRFDGLNDQLLLPTGRSILSPIYVWVVSKRQSNNNGQIPLHFGQSMGLGYVTSVNVAIRDASTTIAGYQWDAWQTLEPSVLSAVIDADSSELRVNGLIVGAGVGLSQSLNNWKVGGAIDQYFNGDIAEIIVMNGVVSLQDRLLIDGYLANKWGIEMDSDSDGIPNASDNVPGDSTQMVDLSQMAPELMGLSSGAKSALSWWLSGDTRAWTLSNSNVTKWADWGRSQGVAIGESVASQPPLQLRENSKLVVSFDGAKHYLNVRPLIEVSHNMTLVVVGQPTNTHETDDQSVSGFDGASGQRYVMYPANLGGDKTSVGISWGRNGVGVYERSATRWAPVLVATEPVLGLASMTLEYTNRVPRLLVNGVQVSQQTSATEGPLFLASDMGGVRGGTAGFYQGQLAEVMAFNQVLSTNDRYIIDMYLAKKWGVISDTDGDGVPNPSDAYPTDNTRVIDVSPYQQSLGRLSSAARLGISLWLRSGATFVMSGTNNRVTKWFDISGKGNHATLASGHVGPQLATSNGKLMMRFEGEQRLNLPVSVLNNQPYHMVIVTQKQGANQIPMIGVDANGGTRFLVGYDTPESLRYQVNSTSVGVQHPLFASTGNRAIWVGNTSEWNGVNLDGSWGKALFNPYEPITDLSELILGTYVPTIMAGYQGDIAEILVWNQSISMSDRYWIDQYLSQEWGVASDTDGDGILNQLDAFPTNNLRTMVMASEAPTLNGWSDLAKSNLVTWLRPTSLGVITGNTGSVRQWLDWSGRGNMAIQATASMQPMVVANGINGNRSIQFDGNNDELYMLSPQLVTGSYTLLAVVQRQVVTNNGSILLDLPVGAGLQVGYTGSDRIGYYHGATLNAQSRWIGNDPIALSVSVGGGGAKEIRINGAVVTSDATISSALSLSNGLVLGRLFAGLMGEIMIFNGQLSTEDRLVADTHLSSQWGVVMDTDSDGVPNSFDFNPTDPSIWVAPSVDALRNELPSANLQLWVVATPSAVMTAGSNGVVRWINWAGRGQPIIQPMANRRPILKLSDGVMGVQFDGLKHSMMMPVLLGNTPFTIGVVETKRALNTGGLKTGHWMGLNNGAMIPFQWGYRANNLGFTMDLGGRGVSINRDTFEDIRRFHTIQLSPTNGITVYLNGAMITQNNLATQLLPAGIEWALGANGVTPSTYYEGDIYEVMVFNEVLSTEDRYVLDQVIAKRWNLIVDTDGDGVDNRIDDAPLDPSIGILDSDGDGIQNPFDAFRFDPLRVVDLAEWSASLNRLSVGVKESLQFWGNAQFGYMSTGNANSVTRLLDLSGNRNHAEQLNTAFSPALISGVNTMIRFDAFDKMALNPSLVSNNYAIYIVQQRRSPLLGTLLTVTTSSGVSLNIGFPTSNILRVSMGTTIMEVTSNQMATTSRWVLGVHFSQASGLMVAMNGAELLSSSSMTVPLSGASGFQLGNGYSGDLGEMMVLTRELLPSERFYIEDYLRVKWGVAMDSDGDGSLNSVDPDSLSPWITDMDADGDGVPNASDAYPFDETRVVDVATIAPTLQGVSANVMSQLGAWLVAMPTWVLSDTNGVSRWFDVSGKKRHFGQRVGVNRPRLVTYLGVSTIDFDGLMDFMTADGPALSGSSYTLYIVERRSRGAGLNPFLGGADASWGVQYVANGQGLEAHHGVMGSTSTVVPAFNQGVMRLIGVKYDAMNLTVLEASKLGSSFQSISGLNPIQGVPTVSLGMLLNGSAPQYYKGEMAEIMMFNGSLTQDMAFAVEGYLSNRWGIPLDSDYDGMPNTWDAFPTDNSRVFSLPAYSSQLNGLSSGVKSGLSLLLDGRTEGLFQVISTVDLKWLDRSELKRHMTWVGVNQPVFLNVSINIGVQFNGTNQVLGVNGVEMAGSTLAMTVVAVVNPSDAMAGSPLSWGDLQSTTGGAWGLEFKNSQWVFTQRQAMQSISMTSNIQTNTGRMGVVMIQFDGRRAGVYVNGKWVGDTKLDNRSPINETLRVGGAMVNGGLSQFYKGLVGDVMVFSGSIATADRYILDSYLETRWGVLMDTDGDGEINSVDPYPLDGKRNSQDLDGDGVPNRIDQLPNDANGVVILSAISPTLNQLSNAGRVSLKGWWVASNNSVLTNAGGQVTQWVDWSGKQHHFLSSGSSAPTLELDGRGVRFSGAQWLEQAADSDWLVANQTPFTIVAIMKPNSNIGLQTILSKAVNGVVGGYGMYSQNGRLRGVRSDGVNGDVIGGIPLLNSVPVVMVAEFTGTEWRVKQNGWVDGMVSANTGWDPNTEAPLQMGALRAADGLMGNFLNGVVSEVMVLKGDVSMQDRWLIDEYLSAKWGIPIDTDGDGVSNVSDTYPTLNTKVTDWPSTLSELETDLRVWSSAMPAMVRQDSMSRVSALLDMSGKLNHFVQQDASLRPTIATSDGRYLMRLTNGATMQTITGVSHNELTIFALVETPVSLPELVERVLIGSPQAGGLTWVYNGSIRGFKAKLAGGADLGASLGAPIQSSEVFAKQFYVLEMNWSDSTNTLLFRVNGIEIARGTANESFTNGTLLQLGGGLGGANGWDGGITEVMVFGRALSELQSRKVSSYLSAKWGLDIDTDGDGAPDATDTYPLDPSKVINLPSWVVPVAGNLKAWFSLSGDNNADGDTTDVGDVNLVSVVGSNSKVSKWVDWSGNRNHAIQTIADRQPVVDVAGGIRFDGLNDALDSLAPASGMAMTAIVIAKTGGSFTGSAKTLLGSGSNGGLTWGIRSNSEFGVGRSGVSSTMGDANFRTSSNLESTLGLFTMTWSDLSNSIQIRQNAMLAGSSVASNLSFDNGKFLRVGGDSSGANWNGNIYEVLLFDRVLSLSEIRSLEYQLSMKWGLDVDSDGDGVSDKNDQYPFDEEKVIDTASANASLKFGDIMPSLVLWINPNDAKRYEKPSNGRLRLYDLTGKRNHALASMAVKSPQVTNLPAGRSAIKFDGLTQALEIPYSDLLNNNQYTIILVGRLNGSTGQNQVLLQSVGNGNGMSLGLNDTGSRLTVSRLNAKVATLNASAVGSTSVRQGVPVVIVMDQDDKVTRVWRNGSMEAMMMGIHSPNKSQSLRIGSGKDQFGQDSNYANFELLELMVFNRRLTEVEQNRVNRYMMINHGIFIFDPVSFRSLFF